MANIATSYDLTTEVKVNMDEAIWMGSPEDLPLLTGFGADGLPVLNSMPVDEIEFFWLEEDILVPSTTAAATAVTAATVITLATGTRDRFEVGDVLTAEVAAGGPKETFLLTAKGSTAETIVVSRAFAGVATQIPNGAAVVSTGQANVEGSDPVDPVYNTRTKYSNYTQIFGMTKVHMSRTQQRIAKYGIDSEFNRQMRNRTVENGIRRERAFLYGRKSSSATTEKRTTGGVEEWITTNANSTNTQLTIANIETQLAACYDEGGIPDQLWANPKSLADLNALADTNRVRVEFADTRRGRKPVMVCDTEYGTLTVVRNRWVLPETAFLVRKAGITRRILDPLIAQRLAKTGDADHVGIVAEEGLEVKGQKHMAKFTGLDY